MKILNNNKSPRKNDIVAEIIKEGESELHIKLSKMIKIVK